MPDLTLQIVIHPRPPLAAGDLIASYDVDFTPSLSAADIDGKKARDEKLDRYVAWMVLTDVPELAVESTRNTINQVTYLVTLPPKDVLNDLGGGQYRMTDSPAIEHEHHRRFTVNPDSLIDVFPLRALEIGLLFNPKMFHPKPIPRFPWPGARGMWWDRHEKIVVPDISTTLSVR